MGNFGKYFLTVQHNKPATSRWVLGTVFIVALWLVVGTFLTVLLLPLNELFTGGGEGLVEDASADEILTGLFAGLPSWLGLSAVLISFVPMFIAVLVAYPLFLKQGMKKVFVVYGRWSWGRTFYGAAVWGGLLVVVTAPALLFGWREFEVIFNPSTFWTFLLVALFLFPIQTTAEEMFFRGWLTQWLASRLSNRWVVSSVSAGLFVLLHLGNPEAGANFVGSVLAWFMIGFVFTWVSLRDGSIELAVGAHFVNNFFAAVLFPYEGSLIPVDGILLLDSDGFALSTFILLGGSVLFIFVTKPKKDDSVVYAGRMFDGSGAHVGSIVMCDDLVKVFTVDSGSNVEWVDMLQGEGFMNGVGFEEMLTMLVGVVDGGSWVKVHYSDVVSAVEGERVFSHQQVG